MADLKKVESFEFEEVEDSPSTPQVDDSIKQVDDFEFEDETSYLKQATQGVVKGADKLLDVGKGIVRGPWNLLTGIGETITGVIDGATGSSITPGFSKAMNYMGKPYETKYTSGKVAEFGSEFGIELIPFMKGLTIASRSARAKKLGLPDPELKSKIGRGLQSLGRTKYGQAMIDDGVNITSRLKSYGASGGLGAVYFGTSGALFAPDNRPTLLGDTFEEIPLPFTDKGIPLPFKTTRTEGLTGRQYAKELFQRKIMRGLDVATASVVVDAGLLGAGTVARTPLAVNTAAGTARILRDATEVASQKMAETALYQGMKDNPVIQRMGEKAERPKRFLKQYLLPDGGADEFLSRSLRDAQDTGNARQREALTALDEFHNSTNNLLRKTKFWQQRKPQAKELEDAINIRLNGGSSEDFAKSWGEDASKSLNRMIDSNIRFQDNVLAQLDDEISSAAPGTERRKKAETVAQTIRDTQETTQVYLRRLFEAHENPILFLKNLDIKDPNYTKAIDEFSNTIRGFDESKGLSEAEVRELARQQVNESIMLPGLNRPGANFDTVVKETIDAMQNHNSKFYGILSADAPKLSVKEDFLIPRKDIIDNSPAFKALMGEITDPVQRITRTLSDLTEALVAKKYYDNLAVNKKLAPTIDKAMDMLDNGGRPPIVMVPSKADLDTRNKFLQTTGKDIRTAQQAKDRNAPSEEALLEISERIGVQDTVQEAAELARLEEILKSKGYIRLGGDEALEESARAIFGGQYGKLTGMYVSPETRAMLLQPVNISPLAGVVSAAQAMRAFSQKMAIVPSPAGQARNIFGNVSMLVGNGNMHRGTNLLDTFYSFSRSLDEIDNAGLKDMARRINYSGLQDTNVIYESLKEYRKMGRELSLGKKTSEIFDKAEDLIPFMSKFNKLYQQSDAFFKALALNGEYNKLVSAIRRSGFELDDQLLLASLVEGGIAKPRTGMVEKMSHLEEAAANIVKDVMPMYNRIPAGLRFMDRIPFFGNFTSFASENIRNGFNTINQGAKELSFTVSPSRRQSMIKELGARGVAPDVAEAQIKAFEASIRANGSQRMFNTLAMASYLPASIQKMSQKMTQTTDTEMQAILDSQEDFTMGDDFMILSNDHRGNFTIVNLSYHNPYGYLRSAANGALEAYARSGRLNKDEYEQIGAGLFKFLEKMGDPFASESMAMERIADATVRRGTTKTGASIYDQDESWGTAIRNGLMHIGESFVPRYGLEFYEVDRDEFREGKLLRALKGMPGKNEEELNVGQEAVRLIFGLSPLELKGGKQVEYDVYEYTQSRDPASSRAKSKMRDADRTTEEKYQAFLDMVTSVEKSQSLMYDRIQRARNLGVPEQEIIRRMSKAGLGNAEIDSLLAGELWLTPTSDDLMKDLEERKKEEGVKFMGDVPFSNIIDYVRENNGRKLESRKYREDQGTAIPEYERYRMIDSFEFEDEEDSLREVDSFEFEEEAVLRPIPQESVIPQIVPPAVPTAPTITASNTQVDPTLLGGDPATQALAKSLGRV